jgi:hypothetical protein
MTDRPDSQPSSTEPSSEISGGISSQGDIHAGRDIAGRDIAGRDIAGRDIRHEETTNIGFSQQAVLRLMIAVGVMVFITAACFFSGGIAIGAGAFLALNRPVNSNLPAAQDLQLKLDAISALPPDQPFRVTFTEEEMSSYFRFFIGPQNGIQDGRVRLLNDNELVIAGNVDSLGGRPAAAVFSVQKNSDQLLHLESAAIRAIGAGNGVFGYVVVPTPLLQPVADRVNAALAGNYQVTKITEDYNEGQPAWSIEGITTR